MRQYGLPLGAERHANLAQDICGQLFIVRSRHLSRHLGPRWRLRTPKRTPNTVLLLLFIGWYESSHRSSHIERNAHCGHLENILLSRITDDRRYLRELGMHRILRARSELYEIRQFHVSRLYFCFFDYIDMIDWQNATVPESPLLARRRIRAGH